MRPTKKRAGERGTMLAELAMVTPLLILILMPVLEGSRVIRTHQVLNNAAREGARLAVLPENRGSTGDIVTQVINYANQNGVTLTAANITINQNAVIPNGGVSIPASIVTVTYTYTPSFLGALAFVGLPTSFPLSTQAEFRNFY
jgi:Flp pilus assembly protein TadG